MDERRNKANLQRGKFCGNAVNESLLRRALKCPFCEELRHSFADMNVGVTQSSQNNFGRP